MPPRIVLCLAIAATAMTAEAEVKPNPLFSDNAVLQRGMEVPVWGTARDGEVVRVEFCGQSLSTVAKDGKWMVRLAPLRAGGPFEMTIQGDNTVTLHNLLVGEVWVCSGQSNMERRLGLRPGQLPIVNWEQEAAAATDPQIRQFAVEHQTADSPRDTLAGSWAICDPEQVRRFTAVGYFFARDLKKSLGVPIGILNSSVGGTPAEAWTRREVLEGNPALKSVFDAYAKAIKDFPARLAEYKASESSLLAQYKEDAAKAAAAGKPAPPKPMAPADPTRSGKRPSCLWNAMIHPLLPYAIRGVVWYQGESNTGRDKQYRTLFPALIADWRQAWGEGDFPFLFVQLPPFRRTQPEFREAQLHTWQTTKNTAMAVTLDCGTPDDIHPPHKQPVGARLALAARAIAYGEPIEYSGPVFLSLKVQGHEAVLSFTHLGGGLTAQGELKGFVIAGADRKFVPAKAEIKGGTVIVTSHEIPEPVAIRYAWANVPEGNLTNTEGLPASPFRTDSE